jgi:DNA-binding transcriptional LysR family regulator
MLDLDPDLLRAFVAVADAGSFTIAADKVGRTQSAVSQKIRRLEETIGLQIFDRSSRSLSSSPTPSTLLIGFRSRLAAGSTTRTFGLKIIR